MKNHLHLLFRKEKTGRKFLLPVLFLFFFALTSFAQTTTWTGDNGSDWHDAGNWSNGNPVAGGFAIIPTNSQSGNYPVMTGFVYANYNITSYGQLTNNAYLLSFGNIILSAVGSFSNNSVIQSFGSIDNKTTFNNHGLVISGVSWMNSGTIVNQNVIYNDGYFNNNGTVENHGTFSNRTNGSINNSVDFENYASFHNTGSYNGNVGCNFDNIGGALYSDGSFGNNGNIYNSGTLTFNGYALNNVAGVITSIATFNNLGDFNNAGQIINSGWMVNNDRLINDFSGAIANTGTIQNNSCSIYSHYSSQALSSTVGNLGVMYEIGSAVNVVWGNGVVLYSTQELPAPDVSCQDIDVVVGSNGSVTISPSQVDGGSTASYCYIASMTVSPNTFTCNDIGTQTVTLTVTDGLGFSNTCFATVEVYCADGAAGDGPAYRAAAPTKETFNTTSLDQVEIFPNPSEDGTLTLQWDGDLEAKNLNLEIVDILGRVVFQKNYLDYSAQQLSFQFSDWNKGTYLVRLSTNEKQVVKKWLKR